MIDKVLVCCFIYLCGVIASSFAQILLKKGAQEKHDRWYQDYLNWRVIIGYGIFFGATLCSVFSYRYLPLSMGPILSALEYLFIAVLARLFLKEKISRNKLIGLEVIVLGILVYSL